MDPEQVFLSVKKDVRSLLISSKHGLSPKQLMKDYQNMLGHPLPLNVLGFRSVLDLVKEIPDVVHLDYSLNGAILLKAIGDDTTRGMEELISKQRDSKHKSKSKMGSTRLFSSRSLGHKNSFVLPRRCHTPLALPAQLRSQLKQLLTHGPILLSELERCYAARYGRTLHVMHYGFFSIAEMLTTASDMIMVKQTRMGSQLMLKTEIAPVKQMLSSTTALSKQSATSRVSTSSVHQERAVLSSVKPEDQQKPKHPAATRIKEIEPAPLVMQEKSFKTSVAKLKEEFRRRIIESEDAGTISQDLKEKLRKLVAEHSQGMAIHNLPTEYKKMYGEDLPVTQCGFLSVTEMVGALSDIFYVQPSTEEGAKHLLIMELKPNEQPAVSLNLSTEGHFSSCYETAWECQDDGGETMKSEESDHEIKITNKIIHQKEDVFPVMVLSHRPVVPLDALQCQKLKPSNQRKERELVPVMVERIESPSHFYIRFNEDPEAHHLENMMFEMRSCYSCSEIAERYRLPDAYVRPGQVCCVAPGGIWFYRVVIHRLLSATEVEVYYVDFGDITVVSSNRLKFLKSCYAELPAQAVPSVLAGVKPVKDVWSQDATRSFQKLCYDRTLVAAVHSYQHDFLLLFLCDTHTEEDLYIHHKLQAEGHAVACTVTSTPVSQQFSPVTLYLGDGQLEEVKEHLTAVTPSVSVTNGQNLTHRLHTDDSILRSQLLTDGVANQQHMQDITSLDLPELEFIDVAQSENSYPFEALQNKDPTSFGNWDEGWTDQIPLLSSVSSIKPDLNKQPVLESKHTWSPALTPQTLSDQTPGLIRSSTHETDTSAELFQPLSSSLLFSVFSAGNGLAQDSLFFRCTSPIALGPSARMAAGPSLLHWYPHKRN